MDGRKLPVDAKKVKIDVGYVKSSSATNEVIDLSKDKEQ